jgi:hypothetical protein
MAGDSRPQAITNSSDETPSGCTREHSRSRAGTLSDVNVIDDGPISYADLERYDDPDIETGLEQVGLRADHAEFRLIELEVSEIEDAANFPFDWQPTFATEALQRGEPHPPVVVMETNRGRGFGLVDGLSRIYAHWLVEEPTVRAYEVLVRRHS